MTKKQALIFVALTLGLGWAIRGHFGHEHGAAWAGALAGLAVIVASGRRDWSGRLPTLAALAGIGWGVGGMMSYGIVVGYGRGVDFANVYYGLTMLGVIGGLYGFIGGGLFGLGLESTSERKPDWARLLTEMIAGGLLAWYVLIAQFEWKMTPPRSELWSACLGASAALAWFLYRNDYKRALRVAGYAALGAGFGFGFGNFLQTMGNVTGLSFNWWNVMEFSLGFFGGLGMAYGVFTREWPESREPSKAANWIAVVFLLLILPVVNIIQAFDPGPFLRAAENLGLADGAAFFRLQVKFACLATVLFAVAGLLVHARTSGASQKPVVVYAPAMFFLYTFYYLIFSHIKNLCFYSGLPFQLNHALYWVVFAVLAGLWLVGRHQQGHVFVVSKPETWRRWLILIGIALVVLAVCTLISINSHPAFPGAHERF